MKQQAPAQQRQINILQAEQVLAALADAAAVGVRIEWVDYPDLKADTTIPVFGDQCR